MRTIDMKPTKKPPQDGMLYCDGCTAFYKPGNWFRGLLSGTDGTPYLMHPCKPNSCPVCGQEQNNP